MPIEAPLTRRTFLPAAAAAAVAAGCADPQPAAEEARQTPPARRIRLGVSTYSYWHFTETKYPIEKVIDHAAATGFDGVEILHRQMEQEGAGYMNALKRRAFEAGLDLIMLSIHQDFVDPEAAKRREAVDHTKHCIDLAHQMGIPAIRLNTGRWGTIRSFDDLMKAEGNEPPIEGYSEEDAIAWCVDSIGECLPRAEQAGVVMALENHWGLSTNPDTLLAIHKQVDSPWLGINMDTGNYVGDPYPQIAKLAPHADIVQAKTYIGGGVWYTLDLDYAVIARTLKDAGFQGYVSLEMEGNAPAEQAVEESFEILRAAFG